MAADLDRQAGRRSHDHTAKLKEIINSKLLWNEYGIDGDITVRYSFIALFQLISLKSSPSRPISLAQTFMRCYRQTSYIS
jgi:hypothetical protein